MKLKTTLSLLIFLLAICKDPFCQTSWSGGTGTIYVENANVGIGTSSPGTLLHLSGSQVTSPGTIGSLIHLSQEWNTTNPVSAITMNITNTNSPGSSRLIDLQVGGVTQFSVNRNGGIYTTGGITSPNLFALTMGTTVSQTGNVPDANFITYSTVYGQSVPVALAGANNTMARNYFGGKSQSIITSNYSAAANLFNSNPVKVSASGTHNLFANVAIKPLTIASDAATLSNTASLYIENAALYSGANNYAFWSAGGNNRFDGNVCIGLPNPVADAKLQVEGNAYCSKLYVGPDDGYSATQLSPYQLAVNGTGVLNKVKVKQYPNWADYVFEDDYNLPNLEVVEQYIKTNRHLPEVPTSAEVAKEGIDLGDTQVMLLKKVEELTLYIIELNKKIQHLEMQISKQLQP